MNPTCYARANFNDRYLKAISEDVSTSKTGDAGTNDDNVVRGNLKNG